MAMAMNATTKASTTFWRQRHTASPVFACYCYAFTAATAAILVGTAAVTAAVEDSNDCCRCRHPKHSTLAATSTTAATSLPSSSQPSLNLFLHFHGCDDITRQPRSLMGSFWQSLALLPTATAVSSSSSSSCAVTLCEGTVKTNVNGDENVGDPSWLRRTLHLWGWHDMPLPRVLLPNDPSLQVPSSLLKLRQKDEEQLQKLQHQVQELLRGNQKNSENKMNKEDVEQKLGELVTQQYELFYGPGLTPADRQEFLAKYGCTAWTKDVLQTIVQVAQGRGVVELGAGHGQWARAITNQVNNYTNTDNNKKNPRDFVLAYDDGSHLPLDPTVYHEKTVPHAKYFGQVHVCHPNPHVVLGSQWKNRGRVLLLVYPSPALAIASLQAYAILGPENDTVIYVGEGRGGANAGHEFFDWLETDRQWKLLQILAVQPFGSKGYEKCFIFQKNHNLTQKE